MAHTHSLIRSICVFYKHTHTNTHHTGGRLPGCRSGAAFRATSKLSGSANAPIHTVSVIICRHLSPVVVDDDAAAARVRVVSDGSRLEHKNLHTTQCHTAFETVYWSRDQSTSPAKKCEHGASRASSGPTARSLPLPKDPKQAQIRTYKIHTVLYVRIEQRAFIFHEPSEWTRMELRAAEYIFTFTPTQRNVHVHIATLVCIFSTHFFYRVVGVLCLCVFATMWPLEDSNRFVHAEPDSSIGANRMCVCVYRRRQTEWQTGRGKVQRYRTQPEPIICSNSVHKRTNAAQKDEKRRKRREKEHTQEYDPERCVVNRRAPDSNTHAHQHKSMFKNIYTLQSRARSFRWR